jgi:hypothetical protein
VNVGLYEFQGCVCGKVQVLISFGSRSDRLAIEKILGKQLRKKNTGRLCEWIAPTWPIERQRGHAVAF